MPDRITQDGWVIVKYSDKMWPTGEENDNPLQYSFLENCMKSLKWQKDMTLKDEIPMFVGAQCATEEEQRKSSRRNEDAESKWKQNPVVDVTGDGSKVHCCKQYCTGIWNVRSMNQGKLEVAK